MYMVEEGGGGGGGRITNMTEEGLGLKRLGQKMWD